MNTFIAKRIIEQAKKSIELGKAKYRAYFVKTKIYEEHRAEVDAILDEDGYSEVIIKD